MIILIPYNEMTTHFGTGLLQQETRRSHLNYSSKNLSIYDNLYTSTLTLVIGLVVQTL